MTELRELYQEVIVDHAKRPRNFRKLEGEIRKVDGYNPLCGDKVTVYLKVKDQVVEDASFEGSGCAVSTASASMMTGLLKHKTVPEALELFGAFHDLVTGVRPVEEMAETLGKLAVFAGVCEFPARVKCASLAWHSAKAALEGAGQQVSTE